MITDDLHWDVPHWETDSPRHLYTTLTTINHLSLSLLISRAKSPLHCDYIIIITRGAHSDL